MRPGTCIAVGSDSRGTLGCFAQDSHGQWVGLSNYHVLYDGSAAADSPVYALPSLGAAFSTARLIGYVGDPFMFEEGADAAFFRLDPAPEEFAASEWPERPLTTRRPELGERVLKVGAATGLTSGIVSAIDVVHTTQANGETVDVLGFEIESQEMTLCAKGDSGSVWIAENGNAIVGLHFGGTPPNQAYACYFDNVLSGLNLRL